MYYSRTFKIIFAVVCLITMLALISGVVHVLFVGMVIYDYNFHAMHDLLPRQEAGAIVRTADIFLFEAALPLVISNLCWIALFLFCYARTSTTKDRSA